MRVLALLLAVLREVFPVAVLTKAGWAALPADRPTRVRFMHWLQEEGTTIDRFVSANVRAGRRASVTVLDAAGNSQVLDLDGRIEALLVDYLIADLGG